MSVYVYADNAATTRLRGEALEAMLPWLGDNYANPSSLHRKGREARKAIENSRRAVAEILGADSGEVFFNSGGTEGAVSAIRGVLRACGGRHIVASAIEHHAVLRTLETLRDEGYDFTLVAPDRDGYISPDVVGRAVRSDTALISVMTANNEIGTVQPVREIGALARKRGVAFHTDAVQAAGHIPINAAVLGADIITISAHKFGGPRGCGAAYIRRGLPFSPLITGGGQERGMRSGTENTAGVAGLAAALTLAAGEMESEAARLTAMRRRLTQGVLKIPASRENGGNGHRLPGIASFSFRGAEGEYVAMFLDNDGIAVSPGSACASGSEEPSHVLTALGLDSQSAKGGLRISLGRENTDGDIDYILEKLPPAVAKLRRLNPSWDPSRYK